MLVRVVAPVATIILLIGLFCALGFMGKTNIHKKILKIMHFLVIMQPEEVEIHVYYYYCAGHIRVNYFVLSLSYINILIVQHLICHVLSLVVCPPVAEVNRTSKASESELMEGLLQCRRQRDDLDLMLHTVTRGYFLHFPF